MEAIIQAHPEGVSIIVANNDDMAAGAARAAAPFTAYKDTIFVGVGGNLAGIDAILAGQETMTIAVDGYDVGYLGCTGRSRCAERQKAGRVHCN